LSYSKSCLSFSDKDGSYFSIALSKSSYIISSLPLKIANKAASLTSADKSAPLNPYKFLDLAI